MIAFGLLRWLHDNCNWATPGSETVSSFGVSYSSRLTEKKCAR